MCTLAQINVTINNIIIVLPQINLINQSYHCHIVMASVIDVTVISLGEYYLKATIICEYQFLHFLRVTLKLQKISY